MDVNFRQNFNDSNFNKSSNFCNIVCGKDTSISAAIFILTLNHADVIGDQSDVVKQNAWFLGTLCAAISGEKSILIQTGAESWGRFPVPRIFRWESKVYIIALLFATPKKLLNFNSLTMYTQKTCMVSMLVHMYLTKSSAW